MKDYQDKIQSPFLGIFGQTVKGANNGYGYEYRNTIVRSQYSSNDPFDIYDDKDQPINPAPIRRSNKKKS